MPGIMRLEEMQATVTECADLGQWLRNKVHKPASAVGGRTHYHSTIIEQSCPLIPLDSGYRKSAQAALDARIMRPEEVRAAIRESADLGQWLGNKVHIPASAVAGHKHYHITITASLPLDTPG